MISDPAVITAIVSILSLFILGAGGTYWLGRLRNQVDHLGKETGQLSNRFDQLDNRVDQLVGQVGQLNNRVDQLDSRVDQLSNRVDQLNHDMREGFRGLHEEIRRGNQQLLQALASHTHDAEGQPTFRVPVGSE